MSQSRTILCEGTNYVSKIIAVALLFFAAGEAAKLYGMAAQARREG